MKRFFRIVFGSLIVPAPFLITSWIWLSQKDEPYKEILNNTWFLISGQWEKLPK